MSRDGVTTNGVESVFRSRKRIWIGVYHPPAKAPGRTLTNLPSA